MKSIQAFEIIADGFGFPEDVDFYEAMFFLKYEVPEVYSLMIEAMTQDVVANIKTKLEGAHA